jgi:hypothetical protein
MDLICEKCCAKGTERTENGLKEKRGIFRTRNREKQRIEEDRTVFIYPQQNQSRENQSARMGNEFGNPASKLGITSLQATTINIERSDALRLIGLAQDFDRRMLIKVARRI